MYKILKNGKTLAITDTLNYIKQAESGVFVGCSANDAQGIAVKNTVYNLVGRSPIAGCESVVVFKVDGGACIENGDASQTETDTLVIDHEYRLTLLEMGVV